MGPGGNSVDQVFASRFLPNPDLANGTWEINGAQRTSLADPTVPRGPSINIHTDKNGTEPRLAGGTTVAGNDPVPWVVWREEAGAAGIGTQIFVAKGVKVSPVVDHDWAKSIYFKDPNGLQLEFCTYTRAFNADDAVMKVKP